MSISNIKHVHHRLKPGSVSISPYPTLKLCCVSSGSSAAADPAPFRNSEQTALLGFGN